MYKLKKIVTKRRIFTVSLALVIFVMSLGYAALSQYIELDGIASIDRSWIVKVTNVTNTPTNSATSVSSNYISNTVTLNANLPTSISTITYTITLSNQGNIPAKLNNIEVIEDENSNITYEITGVEEEVTTLKPGETNTAKVTIKYKSGVTNISETKKELMLTFIYIDNSKPSSSGESSEGEYEIYEVGEAVRLIDGTIWYVTKNSSSNEDKVTLVSENTVSSNGSVSTNGTYTKAFDSNNTNEYDQFDTNNIGYYVKNTVETYIKNSIKNNGGNIAGTTARLLTKEEYGDLTKRGIPSWVPTTNNYNFWLMTKGTSNNTVYYFNGSTITTASATTAKRIRPVIITLKSNVEKILYLNIAILKDNIAQIDTNIDFSKTSEEDGTMGLYYTNKNTEDNKTTYYFRGAVENNYVYFAGFYWRIIRINEDGSIRLIYQGTNSRATGNDATIGASNYIASSLETDNAHVGYMYGAKGSTTYSATHANINDSNIKIFLDNWYRTYLLNNEEYIADSGFCGDRSRVEEAGKWNSQDTGLGYGKNYTQYGPFIRYYYTKTPQFSCPQSNDLYTTSSSNKGNKALDYPIGLITMDEAKYAGGSGKSNSSYYLYINEYFWAISPALYDGYNAGIVRIEQNGIISNYDNSYEMGVRPVINLKATTEILRGNGTLAQPYFVTEFPHSGGRSN